MKRGIKRFALAALGAVLLCVAAAGFPTVSYAAGVKESPYVTLSPDGKAFTTNAGKKDYQWYPTGTTVETGISSSLRTLNRGEHYYGISRTGKVPVGSWKVAYHTGTCCHSNYPPDFGPYHGLDYGKSNCLKYYYSGWFAYCADCGQEVDGHFIYMSKEAAATLTELETGMDYYYLCPHCQNLEQGFAFTRHRCKGISWNRYKVVYDDNVEQKIGGYMEDSIHMYNDVTVYEGKEVTPVTNLTKNTYYRTGYEFVGWNTSPDGSGRSFQDGERIRNLTEENYDKESGKGIITLYAMWKRSESTLQIDPGKGSYQGKRGLTSITQEYGSKYTADPRFLKAPAGYKVSFETNGGSKVAAIVSTQSFREWSMAQPFTGKFKDNVYYFTAENGNKDTLKALYKQDTILLPNASKSGSSFGGWYLDSNCTKPAGGAGESYTPDGDRTLYAKWVELVLKSKPNYTANSKKGAVDLSWTQPDGKNKTYKLYQSMDGSTWKQISSASEVGSTVSAVKSFSFQNKVQTYTVPYTGEYEITLNGAQGGKYGQYTGGLGGRTTARVWLEKGETLSFRVGGQSGYPDGGKGTSYGNGGGSTSIFTARLGTFLYAGGGGGASAGGNGGAGGSSASVGSSAKGADGMAGGGGGYRGGSSGELIVHNHTAGCYRTEDLSYTVMQNSSDVWGSRAAFVNYGTIGRLIVNFNDDDHPWHWWRWGNTMESESAFHVTEKLTDNSFMGMALGGSYRSVPVHVSEIPGRSLESWKATSAGDCIPVNGNNKLVLHAFMDGVLWSGFLEVKDQNGTVIKRLNMSDLPEVSAPVYTGKQSVKAPRDMGGNKFCINEEIALPQGTTGVRIELMMHGTGNVWGGINIGEVSLTGGKKKYLACQYADKPNGYVVSSKPAYGGSNYAGGVLSSTLLPGKNSGNGKASIKAVKIGYVSGQKLDGVTATDQAAPDRITEQTVEKKALSDSMLEVQWQTPKDNGTLYYHKAESYEVGTQKLMCTSNITADTLTVGVKGYYYVTDTSSYTKATVQNSFQTGRSLRIAVTDTKQYLHVAAVDLAGNVGESIHIPIQKKDPEVAWPLETTQIEISSSTGSIAPATEANTYYVRADGTGEFTMEYAGWINGPAYESYQINHSVFALTKLATKETQKITVTTPSHALESGTFELTAQDLERSAEGNAFLLDASNYRTIRSNSCTRLLLRERFLMDKVCHGETLEVIPRVGADWQGDVVYSEEAKDRTHRIFLIGDGEAPEILGLEALEGLDFINRKDQKITLTLTARDELSGVGAFFVEVVNQDNGSRVTFEPDAFGTILLEIEKEQPLFAGDFSVIVYAVDKVGNETSKTYGTTQMELTARISRILEPHDPIFKKGESGELTIVTYGYADRVEVIFPESLTKLDPSLNQIFDYTFLPAYRHEERIQFMIPEKAREAENLEVIVKAYKEDRELEERPVMTIKGSLTEEFRTRLK